MNITPKHLDALLYVASGDYCRPGMQRPDLSGCIQDLKNASHITVDASFNRARLRLTASGKSLMKTLIK